MPPREFQFLTINTRSLWELGSWENLNVTDEGLSLDGSPQGSYTSSVMDSAMDGIKWHKITMDAEIPEGTQIAVSYWISDDEIIPVNPNWSPPLVNPRDALIMGDPGRYLWLRITLFGYGLQTPKLKSVKVYFPRLSYLRYLPAVYQEDAASRDFLDRFLSLFETFLSDLESQILSVGRYFDADATSAGQGVFMGDFLTWLGSWLGTAFHESWPEEKRRKLLRNLPGLYKKRGSKEGLLEFIRIFIGEDPIIVEHFQLDCIDNEENREVWERKELFGESSYSFRVLLLPWQTKTDDELSCVRRIVESEKPAHTMADVTKLLSQICLDTDTYLEINSVIQ